MPGFRIEDCPSSDLARYAVAAALAIPIVLFALPEYDINLTMALLPVAALAMVREYRTPEAFWLAASALVGIAVCLIGALLWAGGLVRSLLSLTLLLTPPAYFFLGKALAKRITPADILQSLALFSALFGIAVAGPLAIWAEPVRVTINGASVLNATFFGAPVFGAFRVLSLAHLFCIQAFLCCGALLACGLGWRHRAFLALGLAALVFLIAASDARSAQGGVIMLLAGLAAYAIFKVVPYASAVLITAAAFVGLAAAFPILITKGSRLADTLVAATLGTGSLAGTPHDLSNGRYETIELAFGEIVQSPIIGAGFGGYGRVSGKPVPRIAALNKSPHVYYLKVLWKGGLLFALPFLIFLVQVASPLWSNWPSAEPEIVFAAGAALTTLLWLNLWWDILNVPSAGALVFFILGLLAARSSRELSEGAKITSGQQAWSEAT